MCSLTAVIMPTAAETAEIPKLINNRLEIANDPLSSSKKVKNKEASNQCSFHKKMAENNNVVVN